MSQTMSISPTTTIRGTKIDVAPLETIDLARLATREPSEIQKLLRAAQSPGIFYLDCRNDLSGKQLLEDLPDVSSTSEKYFDQPHGVKMKDYREGQEASQDRGYKMSGCDESFEIAYEELVQGALELPDPLGNKAELLKHFSLLCHSACHTMLSCLADGLGLDDATRFERFHRTSERSDSALKLVYEPALSKLADVGDNQHTDSGTLTLIFGDQWGIHAELADANKWAFTAPMPGCALINVADSLQRLSSDRLRSPRHRVTQPADGFEKRYFVAYLLRPEHALKEAWAKES